MRVTLDDVPLRDPSLTPAEILMSESQERMMAVVAPANVAEFLRVCAKWDVEATVIGEVTGDGTLTMTWRGGTVVSIPPRTAADGPVYQRPMARPADLDSLQATAPDGLDRPKDGPALRATLLALLGSADEADKSWVTAQYDHYVRGNTVLAMPEDGGLLRVDEQTRLGIALATDGNGRYCRLDPYQGTQLALSEAYRNVAMTGATPVAVTNCLNFGSPEDPQVMWQLAEAVRGLADGCADARHPGHRRQRQPVQPDRRQRHPPHPGNRRARRPRRRQPPSRRRIHHRRGPGGAAGRHPGGVRRLRVGSRHPPASRRPPPGPRP